MRDVYYENMLERRIITGLYERWLQAVAAIGAWHDIMDRGRIVMVGTYHRARCFQRLIHIRGC